MAVVTGSVEALEAEASQEALEAEASQGRRRRLPRGRRRLWRRTVP